MWKNKWMKYSSWLTMWCKLNLVFLFLVRLPVKFIVVLFSNSHLYLVSMECFLFFFFFFFFFFLYFLNCIFFNNISYEITKNTWPYRSMCMCLLWFSFDMSEGEPHHVRAFAPVCVSNVVSTISPASYTSFISLFWTFADFLSLTVVYHFHTICGLWFV